MTNANQDKAACWKDDICLDEKLKNQPRQSKTYSRSPMRFLISSLIILRILVAAASGQETEPTPVPTSPQTAATPQEGSGQTPVASPSPAVSPVPAAQEPPQLLPESKTLPTQPPETVLPRDLIPEGAKPKIPGAVLNPASAEQLDKDKVRFRQLRTIALRNPYANYFLQRARLERTEEMKREYLRVYYITMCDEMRKLEPRLKPMIDTFENANIGRLSQVAIRPTIPERDIPRFQASQRGQ
jgi:hypothetical protein